MKKNKPRIQLLLTPAECREQQEEFFARVHCAQGEYPLCSDRKPCGDCPFVRAQKAFDQGQRLTLLQRKISDLSLSW